MLYVASPSGLQNILPSFEILIIYICPFHLNLIYFEVVLANSFAKEILNYVLMPIEYCKYFKVYMEYFPSKTVLVQRVCYCRFAFTETSSDIANYICEYRIKKLDVQRLENKYIQDKHQHFRRLVILNRTDCTSNTNNNKNC